MPAQAVEKTLTSFLACSLAVLSVAEAAGNERTAEGNWVGGIEVAGKYVFLRGRIERKGGKFSAVIDAPLRGRSASTEALTIAKTVSLRLPIDDNSLHFEGLAAADCISGIVVRADGTKVGEGSLHRWTPVDTKILSLYSGAYSIDENRIITIQDGRFALYYYDSGTGRYGIAYPSGPTEFFLGSAALRFDSVVLRISFVTNAEGRALALRVTDGGATSLEGRRANGFRIEDVIVPNADIRLGATLRLPRSSNRHVGIVLIHGSGPQDRNGFNGGLRIHADELARRGLTVATYDKRGVGSSTGSFDGTTYEQLTADAVGVVRYLRARSDLGLTRIGVSAAQLRAEGLDEATIRGGTTLQILKFYYARTEIGWEGYQEYYQRYHQAPWFEEIIGSPATKESTAWGFWRAINVIEPSEFWRQVRVPSLVIFGGRDRLSPVDRSSVLFREAMTKARNQRFEVKVFPQATHDMHEDPTGAINQMTEIQRYQPGYFDFLFRWIVSTGADVTSRSK